MATRLGVEWKDLVYRRMVAMVCWLACFNGGKGRDELKGREGDGIWYGMVWYGMVWYGMVWYGNICSIYSCCR